MVHPVVLCSQLARKRQACEAGKERVAQSVFLTAVQQRQWAYISWLCGAMRSRCAREQVRLTGSVSNIPHPVGEQGVCSCVWLAGQPTTFDLCVALTTTGIVAAL